MNPVETLLLDFALATILATVKNPAHAAQVKNQLLAAADAIYAAYGLTPPTPPAA